MKCIYRGFCCDKAENDECLAAEDSPCDCRVTEERYRQLQEEIVDPKLCEDCGYRGTPLCTHPGGYYQEEPKGINKLPRGKGGL